MEEKDQRELEENSMQEEVNQRTHPVEVSQEVSDKALDKDMVFKFKKEFLQDVEEMLEAQTEIIMSLVKDQSKQNEDSYQKLVGLLEQHLNSQKENESKESSKSVISEIFDVDNLLKLAVILAKFFEKQDEKSSSRRRRNRRVRRNNNSVVQSRNIEQSALEFLKGFDMKTISDALSILAEIKLDEEKKESEENDE
ncbi:hypothetical protein LCL95_06805 [Bacillus timonensis]|nr:hypothetical protein [Bacillus timonensis]